MTELSRALTVMKAIADLHQNGVQRLLKLGKAVALT